jgi:hypothetical protein
VRVRLLIAIGPLGQGVARLASSSATCARSALTQRTPAGTARSGYVTSAVEVNAPLLKIAEQTRHASLDMLRIYSRRVDLFREHSGLGSSDAPAAATRRGRWRRGRQGTTAPATRKGRHARPKLRGRGPQRTRGSDALGDHEAVTQDTANPQVK